MDNKIGKTFNRIRELFSIKREVSNEMLNRFKSIREAFNRRGGVNNCI